MSLKLAVAFNSAVDQVRNSAQNLQAIRDARTKREREDEMYQLSKKKAEIDLKAAELKGDRTELEIANMKNLSDLYFKDQDAILKGKDAMISQAEQAETAKVRQGSDIVNTIMPQLVRNGIQPVILPNGGVSFKPIARKNSYDEIKVGKRAMALAEKDLIERGEDIKTFKESDPQGYSNLVKKYIPKSEEFFYGKAITNTANEGEPDLVGGIKAGLKYGEIESSSNNGKVLVVSPDGKKGYIPESNLDKALQRGFKRAE